MYEAVTVNYKSFIKGLVHQPAKPTERGRQHDQWGAKTGGRYRLLGGLIAHRCHQFITGESSQ